MVQWKGNQKMGTFPIVPIASRARIDRRCSQQCDPQSSNAIENCFENPADEGTTGNVWRLGNLGSK